MYQLWCCCSLMISLSPWYIWKTCYSCNFLLSILCSSFYLCIPRGPLPSNHFIEVLVPLLNCIQLKTKCFFYFSYHLLLPSNHQNCRQSYSIFTWKHLVFEADDLISQTNYFGYLEYAGFNLQLELFMLEWTSGVIVLKVVWRPDKQL